MRPDRFRSAAPPESRGHVDVRWFPPAPALGAWIEGHAHVEWDLPSGESYRQKLPHLVGFTATFEECGSWIHGIRGRGAGQVLEGRGALWATRFRPGGGPAFLRKDAASFRGVRIPISDVLPSGCLPPLDAEVGGPRDLDEFWQFVGACTAPRRSRSMDLLERLPPAGGSERVDELAAASGRSPRELQRMFRREVGLSPKEYLIRSRLRRAAWWLRSDPDRSCGEVAVDVGCSDQAHFTREFRSMFGRTPDSFRREPRLTRIERA